MINTKTNCWSKYGTTNLKSPVALETLLQSVINDYQNATKKIDK
jgi:hypothetical protein